MLPPSCIEPTLRSTNVPRATWLVPTIPVSGLDVRKLSTHCVGLALKLANTTIQSAVC